jgi:hypothetical protein
MADKLPLVIDEGSTGLARQATTGDVIVCPGLKVSVLSSEVEHLVSINVAGEFYTDPNVTCHAGRISALGFKSYYLTPGRIVLSTTDGELTDSANALFNGTTLTVVNTSQSARGFEIGSLGMQAWALNNCWLSDNMYYDNAVAQFKRIATGTAGAVRFYNDKIWIDAWTTGNAETTVVLTAGQFVMLPGGYVGLKGITSPTAILHLGAGTTAAGTAPLKFTSGPLNSNQEVGAVEFLTDKLYFTITTYTGRKEIVLSEGLTEGRVPVGFTNGRLIDDPVFTYSSGTLSVPNLALTNVGTLPIGHNLLINGGFDFFQRQTPSALTTRSDDTYGPDRWNILTQTASIQCQRTTGDTASNAVDLKQNQASAQRFGIEQILENVDSKPLRGRAVIFQSRVKCSSNQTIRCAILEWTGTADAVTSDVVLSWTSGTYTANNFFLASNLTVTAVGSVLPDANVWATLSVTGTISANCNNLIVLIWIEGTLATDGTLKITEAGLYTETQLRNWGPRPFQQELAMCQRYYEKLYEPDISPGTAPANDLWVSGAMTAWLLYSPNLNYKVTKRVVAIPVIYSAYDGASGYVAEYNVASTFVVNRAAAVEAYGRNVAYIRANAGTFTVGNFERWQWTVDCEL